MSRDRGFPQVLGTFRSLGGKNRHRDGWLWRRTVRVCQAQRLRGAVGGVGGQGGGGCVSIGRMRGLVGDGAGWLVAEVIPDTVCIVVDADNGGLDVG